MDAKYKNPDNDRTLWRTDNAFAPGAATHQGMVYAIQHPFTGKMQNFILGITKSTFIAVFAI